MDVDRANQARVGGDLPMAQADSQPWVEFLNQLHSTDTKVRAHAIRELSKSGDKRLFDRVALFLAEADLTVRCAAVEAVMMLDAQRGVDLVLPLLTDPDSIVRWVASGVLHPLGLNERAVAQLLGAVDTPDTDLHAFAIRELGRFGDNRVFDTVAPLLHDPDVDARCAAAEAIVRIDAQRAIPLILPLLKDPDSMVRWHTCGLLYDCGDERAIEPLIETLADSDSQVRLTAVHALEELGDSRAIPMLRWMHESDVGEDYEGRKVSDAAADAIASIQQRQRKEAR